MAYEKYFKLIFRDIKGTILFEEWDESSFLDYAHLKIFAVNFTKKLRSPK